MSDKNPLNEAAEFDEYAQDYSAGMDNPLKAKLGNSLEDFIAVKLDWLERRFSHIVQSSDSKLLDYGCGAGAFLTALGKRQYPLNKIGCDISEEMLLEAQKRWKPSFGQEAEWVVQKNAQTPFDNHCFDIVIISAVLHHIPILERNAALSEIWRVLKPGGHVVIFEHNPYNPITQYVVARTPIDAHAILLSASEARARLRECQFQNLKTDFIMFGPPKWVMSKKLEAFLPWLPLGAQYAVSAQKPL